MKVVRDIRCENGHVENDTLSDPENSPACRECGAPTSTYFASLADGIRERRADAFIPITFGGVRYESRSDWEKCRSDWKRDHREELNVTGDSRRQSLARLEEANHNALALSRRRGNHRDAAMLEKFSSRIR